MVEIEQAVLGQLLLDNDAIYSLPVGFSGHVFLSALNRKCYETISSVITTGQSVDARLLSIGHKFDPTYLQELTGAACGKALKTYSQTLLDGYRTRQIDAAVHQAAEGVKAGGNRGEIQRQLIERLESSGAAEASDYTSTSSSIDRTLAMLTDMRSGSGGTLKTGIMAIDRQFRIFPGNLVILAARPGLGKSTLAQNIAENIALRGEPVLFHSLEMGDTELDAKSLARFSGVNSEKILSEEAMTDDENRSVIEAAGKLKSIPLYRNTNHDGLSEIISISRKLHRKHGLKLIVVDYLQLARSPTQAVREQEVAFITRSLKRLAMSLGIPVLALSQLNRQVEGRTDPRPRLSDLRESGSLEQDASSVLFLHHPWRFDPDKPANVFELLVAKARMGRAAGEPIRLDGRMDVSTFSTWKG